jgi:hypothetical protein
MSPRNGRAFFFALTVFVLSAATELYPADKTRLDLSHDSIIRIVTQIQRADYEGDQPALKRLHDELAPIPEDNRLASRVLYWRGFALWRRAINGFNESPTPTDLEEDLTQAVTDFKGAIAREPAFVESKIGAGSSLGYLMYLNRKDATRVQELFQQSSPLLKEAMAATPDNPGCSGCSGPFVGRRLQSGEEARIRRLNSTTKDWKQSATRSAMWLIRWNPPGESPSC